MAKRALVLAGLVLLGACNPDDVVHKVGWFATMRHQRNIKPYAHPIAPVDGTVPVTGGELPVTPATANQLVNPRTRTAESLNRGKWVYETYCLVCHGEGGRGDGPISLAGGGPFPGVRSLVTDSMGRGLMPRYSDKVRGTDRWDLVNYVRSLQVLDRGNAGRGRR